MSKFKKRNKEILRQRKMWGISIIQQVALNKFLKLAIAWSKQNDKKISDLNDTYFNSNS